MHRDTEAADAMLERLSDLLRLTLDRVGTQQVCLKDELDFIDKYVEIERARFGDRLRVVVDVDPGILDASVPNLLLQPLVENAVTHGVAHVLEGGAVRIHAERRAASLVITVDNPADRDRPAGRGTGLGLRNVRERLESAYGSDAFLAVEERDGRFRVKVEIPL